MHSTGSNTLNSINQAVIQRSCNEFAQCDPSIDWMVHELCHRLLTHFKKKTRWAVQAKSCLDYIRLFFMDLLFRLKSCNDRKN